MRRMWIGANNMFDRILRILPLLSQRDTLAMRALLTILMILISNRIRNTITNTVTIWVFALCYIVDIIVT